MGVSKSGGTPLRLDKGGRRERVGFCGAGLFWSMTEGCGMEMDGAVLELQIQ